MSLIGRASRLLKANINHLLDSAEDPEVMIKDLIRDMDEALAELRRETVNTVAREKRLERKVQELGEAAERLEAKAALALDHGNEELARKVLGQRVEALKARAGSRDELKRAAALAVQLKADLLRMEEQATLARRKKDELIRRKRAAEARLRTEDRARRSADAVSAVAGHLAAGSAAATSFEGYADAIGEMEARAEATRELAGEDDGEAELRKLVADSEVDRELERLKAERAASS